MKIFDTRIRISEMKNLTVQDFVVFFKVLMFQDSCEETTSVTTHFIQGTVTQSFGPSEVGGDHR